jgi:uncharacterized UBP type Zn finger protein
MGNCQKAFKNQKEIMDFKESWEYEGNIYQKSNYIHIIIYLLKGQIFLKEVNGKIEIEIQGKKKGKQNGIYHLFGEELIKLRDKNKLHFQIIDKNENIGLNNIILTIEKDGNAKIKGENFMLKTNHNTYANAYLYLELYNHKSKDINLFTFNQEQFESSKLINKKDPEDIIMNSLCGMNNLINTCYINSSFQILIHIPEFIKIIRRYSDFEGNIIEEINKIFNQILEKYNQSWPVINPKSFVKYFKSNHLEYNNYFQMDSEMFLEELIWEINLALGDLHEERTNNKNWDNAKNPKEINFYNYIKESEFDTNYEINDLFYVYFIHEKKCKNCQFLTYYYDETPGLKLNFQNTEYITNIDLYTLIMNNFKKSINFKSQILCQNCQKCYDIIETTRIAKLPKILILTLQKANSDNTQKIPWIVKYKPEIGIREIVDIDLLKNISSRYKIFAINNHLGNSPKSGHYFSHIFLEKSKKWYTFNDESVFKYSDLNPNFNNYILFYKQI